MKKTKHNIYKQKLLKYSLKAIEKYVYKKLIKKHYSYIIPEYYYTLQINDIFSNANTRFVSSFKEYLLTEDWTDFLECYFNRAKVKKKLKDLIEYINHTYFIYPNYLCLIEAKYISNNIRQKQNLLNTLNKYKSLESSKSILNDKVFDSKAINSIFNLTSQNSEILRLMNINKNNYNTNNNNNDSIDDIMNIVNNINKIENKGIEIKNNKNELNIYKHKQCTTYNNNYYALSNKRVNTQRNNVLTIEVKPKINILSIQIKKKIKSNTKNKRTSQNNNTNNISNCISTNYNTNKNSFRLIPKPRAISSGYKKIYKVNKDISTIQTTINSSQKSHKKNTSTILLPISTSNRFNTESKIMRTELVSQRSIKYYSKAFFLKIKSNKNISNKFEENNGIKLKYEEFKKYGNKRYSIDHIEKTSKNNNHSKMLTQYSNIKSNNIIYNDKPTLTINHTKQRSEIPKKIVFKSNDNNIFKIEVKYSNNNINKDKKYFSRTITKSKRNYIYDKLKINLDNNKIQNKINAKLNFDILRIKNN